MNNAEERKFIGRLIYKVLTDQINVREAIKMFSKTNDKSIECAYHALVHYGADEDIRRVDIEYREAQDEYLEFMAETLSQGKILPKNIINEYKPYYKGTAGLWHDGIIGVIEILKRYINL